MAPSVGFWKGFKRTLLVLIVLCLIGSVLFFVLLPGAKGLLFGGCTLILVVNLALMLIFVRTNDQNAQAVEAEIESQSASTFIEIDRLFNYII